MNFLIIISFFIIIVGIISLVYIFPNKMFSKQKIKTKTKPTNTTNTTNTTKIDQQLQKSSQDLQEAIKRSEEVKEIVQQYKQKITNNQTNQNFNEGIDTESKKGLDSRLNIHQNLSNPEERDSLGL